MSVPSDKLMELMKSQQGGGAAPAPEPMGMGSPEAPPEAPPMSSPMSTPEPKMGSKEGALVTLGLAMDLIEQSLPAIGSESPEGQKVLSALRTLTGVLGAKKESVNNLKQSEILQMLQTLPQAGGATPEGKSLAAAPAIPGMMPPGAPPSAPPSAPPGMPPGMPPGAPPQPQGV